MRTGVEIRYISPINGEEEFLFIKLKNMDITAIEGTIKEELAKKYPNEKEVQYAITEIA